MMHDVNDALGRELMLRGKTKGSVQQTIFREQMQQYEMPLAISKVIRVEYFSK
jgi:hypothetical protein